MTWILLALGLVLLMFGVAAFFGAPYVPSQPRFVRRAFSQLYPLGEEDTLVDIGAGDGVVLRIAQEFGAKAVGYEINPALWGMATWASRKDDRVSIIFANFWRQPLPETTTVVYAFSVKRDGPRLAKKMQREANRLKRPLALLCLGSPLEAVTPEGSLDAYTLYRFYPSQRNALTV